MRPPDGARGVVLRLPVTAESKRTGRLRIGFIVGEFVHLWQGCFNRVSVNPKGRKLDTCEVLRDATAREMQVGCAL